MALKEIPPIHLSTKTPSQPDTQLLDDSSPAIRYELFPFEYDKALLYDVDDEGDIDPYCKLYDNLVPSSAEETKSATFFPYKKVTVAPTVCFNLEASFEWKDDLVVYVGGVSSWVEDGQAKCLKCTPSGGARASACRGWSKVDGQWSVVHEPQDVEEGHTCGIYYAVMRGDVFVSGFRDEETAYQLGDGASTAYLHNGALYIRNSGDVSSVVVIRKDGCAPHLFPRGCSVSGGANFGGTEKSP